MRSHGTKDKHRAGGPGGRQSQGHVDAARRARQRCVGNVGIGRVGYPCEGVRDAGDSTTWSPGSHSSRMRTHNLALQTSVTVLCVIITERLQFKQSLTKSVGCSMLG